MSGHKPGTDHADHDGFEEAAEPMGTTESIGPESPSSTDLQNSATGTSQDSDPHSNQHSRSAAGGGRTRIGAVAVAGALVLGGATAYGVTSDHASPRSHTAQAQSLDTVAAQQAACDQAAADAAEESAAQQSAVLASAQTVADKAAAAKATAARAAAAAKASRETRRAPLPKPPSKSRGTASGRSSSPPAASYGSAQAIAKQIVPASQYKCFATIIQRESGWNVHARNPSSGAYGLGQALPGSKMASAGPDWQNNPATQIKWALSYMNHRYGSPCAALAFWNAHGWY